MSRGGENVHREFELKLLRGLVEDSGVQHDVVQVVHDIAGELFQITLRVVIMLLNGDSFITFAILSEQGLACARVRQKAAVWAGEECAGLARLGGARFQ